jgi:hypothetical protein
MRTVECIRRYDYDEIWRLHKQGLNSGEIARRIGAAGHGSTVRNALGRLRRLHGEDTSPVPPTKAASEDARKVELARVLIVEEGQSYAMTAPQVGIDHRRLKRLFPGREWPKERQVEAAVMARQLGRLPNRLVRTDINLSGSLLSPQWKEKAA